ncbi:MAG TPA: EAL domain-containing protein [Acidimicrobiales bacterium]|jgi:diguanylate cyclase (GGDEF)-like protein|nr:EAL domain-containing protein [Acidimicrobiales bacterium]
MSDERRALGRALLARADEVGQMVDEQFAVDLKGNAYARARLGTELIARWLSTDEAASDEAVARMSRQGQQAILEDVDLASVAKAYFAWRDITIAVLREEGYRIGTSQHLLRLATNVVRFSCDGSLVRLIRQFDDTRRSLQYRLKEEQARLAQQALHDQLTGLPNRILLTDRLLQATASLDRRGTGAVVLYLDLDNFKAINDRFGHPAGDRLLVTVASRLRALARGGDTVARLGGDEFVVLASDLTDPETAARSLAERIHLAMREPVAVGDRQLHTSVSIGIAPVRPDTDPEECLAQADAAMNQAKRGGPARYEAYNPVIGEDKRRDTQLTHELRTAQERGQFSVHYQPVFTVDGGVVGMEALLRWSHPELGSVPPAEFIPLLERSREIVPIGRWVLEEATRQCRTWQETGQYDLTVSINVSTRQLQNHEFSGDVQQALIRAGLDPGCLVVEITESALVTEMAHIEPVMRRIRDLGVHIALDNFGTGYSSLLYLKGLPIDRLKVDRSFVSGLGSAGQDPTVVATVVDLAHKLGLQVVAEGVETEAELRAVGAMGCDEVQGFLLGRPGPAESFPTESLPDERPVLTGT